MPTIPDSQQEIWVRDYLCSKRVYQMRPILLAEPDSGFIATAKMRGYFYISDSNLVYLNA